MTTAGDRGDGSTPPVFTVNLRESKNAAAIVRAVACQRLGMREMDSASANLFWYERAIKVSEVSMMDRLQRVNMIPGMHDMARKLSLARVLNRLRRCFPDDYDFFPRTWSLPLEAAAFAEHCASNARTQPPPAYIVKPSAGAQGAGIYLTSGPETMRSHSAAVVQEYIAKPLLLDGLKFDLRCYALVLSVQPLVVYVYREAMARFATSPYAPPDASNMHNVFMHLTNYSLYARGPLVLESRSLGMACATV